MSSLFILDLLIFIVLIKPLRIILYVSKKPNRTKRSKMQRGLTKLRALSFFIFDKAKRQSYKKICLTKEIIQIIRDILKKGGGRGDTMSHRLYLHFETQD
jgi:hypothetical protein